MCDFGKTSSHLNKNLICFISQNSQNIKVISLIYNIILFLTEVIYNCAILTAIFDPGTFFIMCDTITIICTIFWALKENDIVPPKTTELCPAWKHKLPKFSSQRKHNCLCFDQHDVNRYIPLTCHLFLNNKHLFLYKIYMCLLFIL